MPSKCSKETILNDLFQELTPRIILPKGCILHSVLNWKFGRFGILILASVRISYILESVKNANEFSWKIMNRKTYQTKSRPVRAPKPLCLNHSWWMNCDSTMGTMQISQEKKRISHHWIYIFANLEYLVVASRKNAMWIIWFETTDLQQFHKNIWNFRRMVRKPISSWRQKVSDFFTEFLLHPSWRRDLMTYKIRWNLYVELTFIKS